MTQGRTCAAEVLLGIIPSQEGAEGWRMSTSESAAGEESGRAIIAPARKLPGIICHTLKTLGLPGVREFLPAGNYSVRGLASSLRTRQTS